MRWKTQIKALPAELCRVVDLTAPRCWSGCLCFFWSVSLIGSGGNTSNTAVTDGTKSIPTYASWELSNGSAMMETLQPVSADGMCIPIIRQGAEVG